MTSLLLPTFRCGHEKAGMNIQRAEVRGKLYHRCRECHPRASSMAVKREYMRWRKAVG